LETILTRPRAIWQQLFHTASLPRTLLEIAVLYAGLSLLAALIYESTVESLYSVALMFFINPICSLCYALRLRPARGRKLRQIGVELLWLCIVAVFANGLALVMATWISPIMLNESNTLFAFALIGGVLVFPYFFFRIFVRLWVWWGHLRERRLIWSLMNSHLIAVALLQAIVILPSTLLLMTTMSYETLADFLPNNPFAHFFYRLTLALPMLGLAILASIALLFALLPFSALVSYLFARRTRRRLQALMDAAHAARDGDYQTRIPVSGKDEIAKLQTDFNTMASNLESHVSALRDEREKVAALLHSRRELMASVSHELRTPIATVRAYLESALRRGEGDSLSALSEADLSVIQRETLRLQALVDDLFALSRAEVDQLALKCVPTSAPAVIQRVVNTVAPMAWQVNRVEVAAQAPSWLPPVLADESRLEQVLRNLIHNSLRHTPPGGIVFVSAREADGRAEIQVRDTGEGISADDLPHVWDRYYRGSANGGTGLGLALVKSFTEAMGGQVAVESAPGEGACFTVILPLSSSVDDTVSLPKPEPVLLTPSAKPRLKTPSP
jgi:signal transduction histidine kinase